MIYDLPRILKGGYDNIYSRPSIKKELRCEQQHIILAKLLETRTENVSRNIECPNSYVLIITYVKDSLYF